MKIARTLLNLALATALLFSVATGPAALAALGAPGEPAIQGVIQNIDYLHHAVTINGQTYAVAKSAKFSGIAGFSVLHVGMPVAYTLGTTPSNSKPGPDPGAPASPDAPVYVPGNTPPSVITSITWSPGEV